MRRSEVWIAALALAWAGCWVFFVVVESWVWNTPVRLVLPWAAMAAAFLALALLPAACVYAVRPPQELGLAARILRTIMFGAHPLVAGALFVFSSRTPGNSGLKPSAG